MKYSTATTRSMFALLLTLAVASLTGIKAQDGDPKIRVDTNLILIDVLVRDKNGRPLKGLTAENFELFEDDKMRPIENYTSEDAPVSFSIVYDMHPTTAERTRSVIQALAHFKQELQPADDIFLLAFNMRGQQMFDFVPTMEQLEKYMADPDKREPYSLYDAIYHASERIRSSRNQKRVLVVISDSADHNSRRTFAEVRDRVRDMKVEVYAVIFNSDDDMRYADLSHKSRESRQFSSDASPLERAAIQDLTLRSGGGTYSGDPKNTYRLLMIYKEIANEMRAHHTLGFYPDKIDEKRHSIRVRLRNVAGSKDFALTYRLSYQNRARAGKP